MKPKSFLWMGLALLIFSLLNSCTQKNTKKQENSNDSSQQTSDTNVSQSETDYTAMGKKMATETQAVLAKNLVEAIHQGGTEYALEFCNSRAYPITDSMAKVLNTGIKRVTDKTRNPGNQANESELAQIELLKNNLANGVKPKPKVIEMNGKMIGYYPIVTNKMCMQCHGKKEIDINAATLRKIHILYPADRATGYGENELRGLWVVEMNKK